MLTGPRCPKCDHYDEFALKKLETLKTVGPDLKLTDVATVYLVYCKSCGAVVGVSSVPELLPGRYWR